MGFNGVCFSNGLMYLGRFMVTILLVKFGGDIQSFPDVSLFSYETTNNVWPTLIFGMKGILMGMWQRGTYDVFSLMTSYLGPEELAAATVVKSIGMISITIPQGFQ